MDSSIDNTVIKKSSFLKMLALYPLAFFFVLAGARHFITPEYYMKLMPSYLPAHLILIYTSGFFAILGGVGLMIPRLKSFSAWGLMVLLLAVLPANINMWTNNIELPNALTPNWYILLRILLQFILIGWLFILAENQKDF